MRVYYNENDAKACLWLRELIRAGMIPEGDIDERSIADVSGDDLRGYDQCHFFAGIGGWPYALKLAGWDGPVWTGSCPCQPFSSAGKQKGSKDHRNLWPDFFRLIEELRPDAVFGEQVDKAVGFGWIDRVRADLEAAAYTLGIAVLGAHSAGAPHIRQRLYWVADAGCGSIQPQRIAGIMAGARSESEGSARERERRRDAAFDSGATVRLGDSNEQGPQRRRLDIGEHADKCIAGPAGAIGRLDLAAGARCAGDGIGGTAEEIRDEARLPESSGRSASGRVGHAAISGIRTLDRKSESQPERQSEIGGSGLPGFWSSFDILHCTDGKARRIEPGTFPLAHGIPARVGRLRGYGNAVVPQVAAEFVRAFMEVAG